MKIDILAFGAHPDDVELGCGGTLIKHRKSGYTTGIIDLTKGELGTRGTVEIRQAESDMASEIMGCSIRENLGLRDGFFTNDEGTRLKVIEIIRKYRPEIVLVPATYDRHPDHKRAGELVAEACFYSGLQKIKTVENGEHQVHWRPKSIYHYIQFIDLRPDFCVDISDVIEEKMAAVFAHKSQFHDPESREIPTFISSPEFSDYTRYRTQTTGIQSGFSNAEGFQYRRLPGVKNLFDLS